MKKTILILLCILALSGCTTQTKEEPTENALFCESDSDCRYQETDCNGCACPEVINNDNWKELECEPSEYACALFCVRTTIKCVDNSCTLIEN